MTGLFQRTLEVLKPTGAIVLVMESYFDESGDLEVAPGVFCISGYFVTPHHAKLMDAAWEKVLKDHNLPYFHMVDCAHEPPAGPFAGMPKEERIEIVKNLIALIKEHTAEGFSIFARSDEYTGPEAPRTFIRLRRKRAPMRSACL